MRADVKCDMQKCLGLTEQTERALFLLSVIIEITEYSCAAEPPVRCGVSHLSRRNEPL